MNPVLGFVRNPVKVTVGVLIVALFGAIALFRMPMQLVPEVQIPTIKIETMWPGASPLEVEREIVQEQEEQLKGVEAMTKLSSQSMDSRGEVNLEFAVGTDMAEALLKVNARLQQVREYPQEAREPVLTTSAGTEQPIGWFVLRPRLPAREQLDAFLKEHPGLTEAIAPVKSAHNTGLAYMRLREAADRHPSIEALLPEVDVDALRDFTEDVVEARFERVAGVSAATVFGGRERELKVIVDPHRLAARDVTIADVRLALQGRNKDTSGGDFWEGKRRYVVRTLGQFGSPEEVEGVLLARRDGVSVYVRDVAEVRLGLKKPEALVRNFGTPCLAINAERETGSNVLQVMEGLREAVEELNAGVLKDRALELVQVYDETDYIYSAIGLVGENAVWGGLLTVLVLLVFLRSARSTLVIGLAIPTSIIGAFLLLSLMGRSLNVISLAGMAFAIGMLVDNAVVVLENIFRHHQMGKKPWRAAVEGTQEVWGAVIASTLTTLAVFLPVLFVEEEAGQFFRDIALAISCSVGLSLLVSVIVIPTATARVLGEKQARVSRPGGALGRFGVGAIDLIVSLNRFFQGSLRRQIATVVILIGAALAGTWALIPKVEYLPEGNRNIVFGFVIPPPGYNLDEMYAVGTKIQDTLRPFYDLDPEGPEAEALKGPAIADFFIVAINRRVFMGFRAFDPLRASELVPIGRGAIGTIPGVFPYVAQGSLFGRGLTAGRTIDVEIRGPELEKLVMLGYRVMGRVREEIPGAQIVPQSSLDLSSPEVHVVPKWERAADMQATALTLGYTVDSLVDGAYAGDYFIGGDKIDITIVGQERFAGRFQDIEDLPIATPSGDLVPLRALADVRLGSGPDQIDHRERQRAIVIQVTPPIDVALEDAMDRVTNNVVGPMKAEGALGDGTRIDLGGTADKLVATWEALRFNVLLALLITYLLMAALFESWLYPFVVILSVPLGAVGGFLGLWILNRFVNQPLDVLTMLGFVILIGTVVNNAILIVHQSLVYIRQEGRPPREAIPEAVRTRVRPIFMTMFTTVFGLLPLVVRPGAGSELYRGLGSVLLGGLMISTIFTLFLVPTFFRMALDLREAFARR